MLAQKMRELEPSRLPLDVLAIQAQAFDAAMLDLNLDGRKSYAVADALGARGVPFPFSTGYSSQSLDDGYRNQPVLGKPYRIAELVEVLTRLLRP